MHETEAQIRELQTIIDRSFAAAGKHLVSIISEDKRLNARQLVEYLQGTKHIAVATVSSRGEPRVSPVDGHFLRGRFLLRHRGRFDQSASPASQSRD